MGTGVESLTVRLFSEAIATFFFLSVAFLAGNPLSAGVALAAGVMLSSQYSGGVLNPAASLALWLKGDLSVGVALLYSLAQCLGAAAVVLYLKMGPRMLGGTKDK